MGNGDGSSNAVRIHLSVPALPGGYKLGSLQAFAAHKCDANDFSPSVFSADNVHRIGIIDIRLLNTDRHAGNLLVAESSPLPNVGSNGSVDVNSGVGAQGTGTALRAPYVLVPIDHGFALPEALEEPYFEWMYWAQTSVPFSEEVRTSTLHTVPSHTQKSQCFHAADIISLFLFYATHMHKWRVVGVGAGVRGSSQCKARHRNAARATAGSPHRMPPLP